MVCIGPANFSPASQMVPHRPILIALWTKKIYRGHLQSHVMVQNPLGPKCSARLPPIIEPTTQYISEEYYILNFLYVDPSIKIDSIMRVIILTYVFFYIRAKFSPTIAIVIWLPTRYWQCPNQNITLILSPKTIPPPTSSYSDIDLL